MHQQIPESFYKMREWAGKGLAILGTWDWGLVFAPTYKF